MPVLIDIIGESLSFKGSLPIRDAAGTDVPLGISGAQERRESTEAMLPSSTGNRWITLRKDSSLGSVMI
ncbi:MAG: hypothetical protein WBG50_16470 [Desulfomonilaceae bacterium]